MVRWHVGGLIISFFWSFMAMAASGAGITYHGRLLKADGTPVTSSSVQFQIQIRTPGSENCLMYQETQTKDLSATSGVFSITINDGTATVPNSEPFTLSALFKNSGSFSFGAGKCSGGSTYNPSPTDGRKLAVSFNDGSGWETLPAQEINFVPLALESESVGGKTPASFLRVDSSAESSNTTELTAADLTNFWDLLNGTSGQYMKSSSSNGANLPPLSGAPTAPSAGTVWYDSTNNKIKYFDGTTTQTVGTSGGSVTGITVGTGLVDGSGNTGTTITTSGTIKLPAVGTADTYYKVTTDAEGRVTSGSTSLAESDLPNITTAGKVSGSAITSGTIGGSTAITTSGDLSVHSITSSGNVSLTAAGGAVSASYIKGHDIQIYDSVAAPNTHMATIEVPASLSDNYTLILPADDGTSGQVLSTDGNGNLSWISPAAGSVTSVTASAPLSVDATTASAPALSISKADTSTDGYLSSTDWTTFNNKLSAITNTAALSDGKVWVGDSSGKAQEKALSGDVGLTDAGVASVNKIKGYGLDFSTAPVSGDFLKYNGTNWVATAITESDVGGLSTDLDDKISAGQMPANCTSGQTLTFSSPTGTWACSNITVSGSSFASQTANTVLAAPDGTAGAPTFRVLTANDLPSGIVTQWSDGPGGAIYYNDGNVGIGTATPGSLLTVNGRLETNGGLLLDQGSGATDNLIYTGSSSAGPVDASMGFFVAGVGSGSAGDGPYFLGRGNSFSAVSKQRGNIYLAAGNPTSPDSAEGSIHFWTGNEQSRMTIANNGNIGIGMSPPFGKLSIADDGYDGTTDILTASYLPGLSILSDSDYVGLTSLDRDGDMTTTTDDKDGMLYWGDNTDDNFRFASVTSNQATTRMIITGSGDVGIGTITPSEKLEVNGNVKATAFIGDGSQLTGITASGVSSGAGTAAAPSMSFSSDPDTGFYSSGTNEIGVSAGGANIFNLSSLGLTSPTSGGGVVTTAAGTSLAPTFSFSGDTDTGWYHPADDTLAAATGGTERVRIDANGNMGIGTTAPSENLVVGDDLGNITSGNAIVVGNTNGVSMLAAGEDSGNMAYFGWDNTNDFASFGTAESATAYKNTLVLKTGNVGIGTTVPGAKLQVETIDTAIAAQTDIGSGSKIIVRPATSSAATYIGANNVATTNGGAGKNITGVLYGSNNVAKHDDTGTVTTAIGSNNSVVVSSSAGAVSNVYGTNSTTSLGANNTTDNAYGIVGITANSSASGTITGAYGVLGRIDNSSTGTVVSANAVYGNIMNTGLITAAYAGKFSFLSNTGTIGTGYGVYIGDVLATTQYGLYQAGADDKNYFAGNVGIGTTNPNSLLTVEGVTALKETTAPSSTTNYGKLYVKSSDHKLYFMNASGVEAELGASGGGSGDFMADGSVAMTGNIKLNGHYLSGDGGNEGLHVDSDGNVAVGSAGALTTVTGTNFFSGVTPKLEILTGDSTAASEDLVTIRHTGLNSTGVTRRLGLLFKASNEANTTESAKSGGIMLEASAPWSGQPQLSLLVADQERLTVTNGGNVGIGTTAPAQKLDVWGNIAVSGTTVHSSDRRLKEDIVPLQDSLNKILTLSGYNYYWKNKSISDRRQVGVIAQEVKKVFPELVYQNQQTGYYSVNYEGLIPPLIESIKQMHGLCKMSQEQEDDLRAELARHDRELASLNTRVNALKAAMAAKDKETKALEERLRALETSHR